jgi:Mn-containing catalase
MAAYTKARNLAVLMRHPEIVQLLTVSLGEEQNAGQLLVRWPPPVSGTPAGIG